MEKETMKKDELSIKNAIYRLKKTYDDILDKIPEAEEKVEQLKDLEHSTNSHERMEYLSACLELASLKNDLANTKALLTLKIDQLERLQKSSSDATLSAGQEFGE